MSIQAKVTSSDIKRALSKRYHFESCGFFEEIAVGPDANGNLRLDGVNLVRRAPGMQAHGFEIKVDRGDFLRDAKYTLYAQYVNSLTLVCPSGMIAREEVPQAIGLMWYTPSSGALRYRRRPVFNEDANISAVRDAILTRLCFANRERDRYRHYADARGFLEEKEDWRNVGLRFGTAMSRRLEELERERLDVEAKKEELVRLDALENVMRSHGVSPWGDLGAKRLDDALTERGVRPGAVEMQCGIIADALNHLLRQAELPEYGKKDASDGRNDAAARTAG
jgi:hypothetical protein